MKEERVYILMKTDNLPWGRLEFGYRKTLLRRWRRNSLTGPAFGAVNVRLFSSGAEEKTECNITERFQQRKMKVQFMVRICLYLYHVATNSVLNSML